MRLRKNGKFAEVLAEDGSKDSPTYEQWFWRGDAQLSSLIKALPSTDWNTAIPMWMMNWVVSIFETEKVTGCADHDGMICID